MIHTKSDSSSSSGRKKRYYVGVGDLVPVDASKGVYIKMVRIVSNSLCPTAYGADVKCFWEGQIVADFEVIDARGTVLREFEFGTHHTASSQSRNLHFIYGKDSILFYAHATGRYDAGPTRKDAKMEIVVSVQ